MGDNGILLFCAFLLTLTGANWTPDPRCPYPSSEPARSPYAGHCAMYWECFEGSRYVMECPKGLEFSASLQRCEPPEIAKCSENSTVAPTVNPPSTTHSDWRPDPACPYPSENITYIPYPYDCHKYWECFEGNKYLFTCPSDLLWNEEKKECDYAENVHCDPATSTVRPPTKAPKPTPGPATTPSAQTTLHPWTPDPKCPFPSDEVTYYNYAGDCNRYWECYRGVRTLMSCPTGLYWDEKNTRCDYPENVDCDPATTTEPPPTTSPKPATTSQAPRTTGTHGPWTPDPICPYPSEKTTYFSDPKDCNKYFECFAGTKTAMFCPSGLYWDNRNFRCDYPENVDCKN